MSTSSFPLSRQLLEYCILMLSTVLKVCTHPHTHSITPTHTHIALAKRIVATCNSLVGAVDRSKCIVAVRTSTSALTDLSQVFTLNGFVPELPFVVAMAGSASKKVVIFTASKASTKSREETVRNALKRRGRFKTLTNLRYDILLLQAAALQQL